MRALSVKQPWAELIARGKKKKEFRTWTRKCFGELLIVASKSPNADDIAEQKMDASSLVFGRAVCIVDFYKVTGDEDDYAWHLRNPRRVEPIAVKGSASLYHVADSLIHLLGSSTAEPASPAAKPPITTSTKRSRPSPKPREVPKAPLTPRSTTRSAAALDRNVVVLVDPDPKRCADYASALRGGGFGVVTCADRSEAWSVICKHRPGSVVAQASLGRQSGLDLLFHCRGTPELDGLRFYLAGDCALLRGIDCDGIVGSLADLLNLVGKTNGPAG